MNENTRQVLERFHAARRELEQQMLAELILFQGRWGVTVNAVSLEQVDITMIGDERPQKALTAIVIHCGQ
jgi:uncharacterized protein YigA (DUF484 family)